MRPCMMDELSIASCRARQWAETLEERERQRSGVALPIARRAVARRLRVAPGTLENLRRGRLKDVKTGLFEALRQAIIDEAESEIRRLERTIAGARAAHLVEQIDALERRRAALLDEVSI